MEFNSFHLKCLGTAAFAALLAFALPLSAQQQGPVVPQAPAGAPQTPAGAPRTAEVFPRPATERDAPPVAPGTPAREGASLVGLSSWRDRLGSGASEGYAAPPILPPDLPERVTIPMGTRIPMVLETALSSQFSHRGQPVVFRTTESIWLGEDLSVPPGAEIRGRVTEVTRPGAFGKSGTLRVTVERMVLPGSGDAAAALNLRAQLRSGDISARGRLTNERRRMVDRQGLAVLSVQGALAGAQFGGKAAGIGAGAGAALAAVLMMSKKGRDVSMSPGTPFSVRLQQDADLPAPAVYWAQQDYASKLALPSGADDDRDEGLDDGTRPVLKRRPLLPAPRP